MKTKRTNSKQKGKRIELEFVNFLKERGFHARRSQQYCGANSDADVEVEELSNFHFEVKGGKQVPAKIYKFMEQAVNDAKGKKCPKECWLEYDEKWNKHLRDFIDPLKTNLSQYKDYDENKKPSKPSINCYIPFEYRGLCPVHQKINQKIPICILKRDREEFLIVMRGEDWINEKRIPKELLKTFKSPANLQYASAEAKPDSMNLSQAVDNAVKWGYLQKNVNKMGTLVEKARIEALATENNYGRGIVEESEEF